MNPTLKQMLTNTSQAMTKNKELKQLKQTELEKSNQLELTNEYDKTSKPVKVIESLGLKIDSFLLHDNSGHYDSYDYHNEETYYVSNDLWDIELKYSFSDSTFLVSKLTNKETGEKIEDFCFYCDLFCGITSEERLNQFKYLITHSLDEYINYEFNQYHALPELLRLKGYEVFEEDFNFNINGCNGFLIVRNYKITRKPCRVKISQNTENTLLRLSNITNNPNIGFYFDEKIEYVVDYKSEKDINLLMSNIDKILEHIDGKFGYHENKRYFNNSDVESLFDKFENKFEYLVDITNGYQYLERETEEDFEEYNRLKELAEINHFKGSEIYKKHLLNNDKNDVYWRGGIKNEFEIEFIYNLNIDKDYCIVNITNSIIEYRGQRCCNSNRYEDIENEISNKETTTTIKGSFLECCSQIEEFLNELAKI